MGRARMELRKKKNCTGVSRERLFFFIFPP
jgi:hypothetical protein